MTLGGARVSILKTQVSIPDDIAAKPPEERTKHEKAVVERIEALNKDLTRAAGAGARFDPTAGVFRFFFVIGLATVTLLATVGLLWVLFTSDETVKTITAGAALVGVLSVAGLVNPLQTVERDTVFRRWSDMIAHTFMIQAADDRLKASRLKAAADDANARFTSLATAYAAATSKTLETLALSLDASKEEEEEEADESGISITNPGTQTSKKGTEIQELQIDAKGGKTLSFADGGTLPAGLSIASDSGVVSGTPENDAATADAVKITVADSEQGLEGSVTFKWTIEEASAAS
jgi:putative Ig domain-containing protein